MFVTLPQNLVWHIHILEAQKIHLPVAIYCTQTHMKYSQWLETGY